MAFENVDLFDAVANASLEKYGWQDRCEAKLIVLSENATYMVKNKETGEKESEAANKRGTATGPSAEKRVRKTVENPTETGSALRKTGEETAEMGNVETTVSGAVSKE